MKKCKTFYDWCVENEKEHLLDEWDYKKNGEITPKDVAMSTQQKVWWIYHYFDTKTGKKFDFSWQTSVYQRQRGRGCPYICVPAKKIYVGFNDLVTTDPDISKEWNYSLNNFKKPEDYTFGSKEKIWWTCPKNHNYEARIVERTRGNGCPYCSGKKVLKGYNDFLTKFPKLALEWDYDKNKIKPDEITYGANKIKIWWKCKNGHSWQKTPNHRTNGKGTGCPICASRIIQKGFNDLLTTNPELESRWDFDKNCNIDIFSASKGSEKVVWWKCKNGHSFQDKIYVMSQSPNLCPVCSNTKIVKGINDLSTSYPLLMEEWDFKKNTLNPYKTSYGNTKKAWWICKKCKKEWQASISSRTSLNTGCPYCAGQLVNSGINDLKTKFPEIAKEWDTTKNKIEPSMVMPGSNKKYFWKCKLGHSYKMTVVDRTSGSGCPYCINKKILVGYNDLSTTNPELLKEWNYDKNILKPTEVVAGSDKKVWWICGKQHEWRATISSRKAGRGCPTCFSQFQSSFPEKTMYFYLRKYFKNVEHNISFDWLGKMELDIFLVDQKIAIEYDGAFWHSSIEKDKKKDELCLNNNIKLIRIREDGCPKYESQSIKIELTGNPYDSGYLTKIIINLLLQIKEIAQLDFKEDINIDRDNSEILQLIKKGDVKNSLEAIRPDLSNEWNYDKNGKLLPSMFSAGSNKKVWWKCKNGHEWQAVINSRFGGNNCPYCSNQRCLTGYNDFLTITPRLKEEWDFEKNKNIIASNVITGSNKKYWWKCSKNHSWQATVWSRQKGNNCPFCSNKKVLVGYNDLFTLCPNLEKEWDFKKNTISPKEVTAGTEKSVWWICEYGHSYKTNIRSRAVLKTRCPICYKNKRRGIPLGQMYFPFLYD